MLMIVATTPEDTRAEILKYIAWLKRCETQNEKLFTSERDKRTARYTKNLLAAMERDLTAAVIVEKS
jgi:hypothetical protein